MSNPRSVSGVGGWLTFGAGGGYCLASDLRQEPIQLLGNINI